MRDARISTASRLARRRWPDGRHDHGDQARHAAGSGVETAAKIYWREAHDIFHQLGVPEAAMVELRLYGPDSSTVA
jgi:hypothetical protein